ncbi:hypothetical protein M4951_06015 [Blastopirellula sp. J2-11]|uniref:hypothetical protein n=1 Tax=Blastopirellula sp. J2-11 TaxID=2943192 RepID=UPI0021CACC25|nr:hypothetical protein [Blastopirellula sp. J2-11]UUO07866.1 hypothetical protein M4951_06015 [Blastopirellula sp. J2-11]
MNIVERGGYATVKRDGELVQRTVRYVRQLNRLTTARGMKRAVKENPDLYLALKLLQEQSNRVLELKARMLAGQTDQAIARAIGFPVHGVATFAALYFDVRARLKATSWIRWVAIGVDPGQANSPETLFLLHAWKRGPMVIEPWLDYLGYEQESHNLGSVIGRQRAWIAHLIDVAQLPATSNISKSLWKASYFTLGNPPKAVESTSIRNTVSRNRATILAEYAWEKPKMDQVAEVGRRNQAPINAKSFTMGRLVKTG